MGQIEEVPEKRGGDRRGEFPKLAAWVDVLRKEFGPELGGELIEPDGTVRRWGQRLSSKVGV